MGRLGYDRGPSGLTIKSVSLENIPMKEKVDAVIFIPFL
jgi:hypothetical protein